MIIATFFNFRPYVWVIIMKTTKKLIMPIISLLMTSVVLVIAITYAWFAFNDRTTSHGMDISVKCSPNLIIASSSDSFEIDTYELSKGLIPTNGTDDGEFPEITATTHVNSSPTGLGYLRNSYAIDPETGVIKGSYNEQLIVDDVTVSELNGRIYYVDYKVYVASSGDEFPSDTNLVAKMINDNENMDNVFNATSVDFYFSSDDEASFSFIGALNFANLDYTNTGNEVEELILHTGSIPLYTSDYFVIIMRCYFDGNLVDPDSNHTFITSNEVNELATAENVITLGVEIFTR